MIQLILLLAIETSCTEVKTYGKLISPQNHVQSCSHLSISSMLYGNAIIMFKMNSFWEKRLQST